MSPPEDIAQDCLLQAGIAREMGAEGDAASLERAAIAIVALRESLREIALHGTTAPAEMGDMSENAGFWKQIAYDCMATAARALQHEVGSVPLPEQT